MHGICKCHKTTIMGKITTILQKQCPIVKNKKLRVKWWLPGVGCKSDSVEGYQLGNE